MRKVSWVVLFLCLVMLVACAPKSGKRNVDLALSDLEHKYKEEFEFIEVVGVNNEGYDVLLVAPASNLDIQFHAYLYQGDAGGLPTIGMTNNYIDIAFLHFAPDLYQKHFGISIDKVEVLDDYFKFVEEENYSNLRKFDKFLATTDFVIKDVKQENMEEMSERLADTLLDFLNIHPFSMRKVDGGSAYDVFSIGIPYQLTKGDYDEWQMFDEIYSSWVVNEENPEQAVYQGFLWDLGESE
ncbi:hypothetical protein [Paucisalibacillus sp. EB02]|uniref:hypothetical protein n=1 Tax=Paucisalibacillus sp. EB02 TaxID=1347087 RepID=UPI0004AC590E|nr:hypothetical protein [Paucisalibacillus sp. EB02]